MIDEKIVDNLVDAKEILSNLLYAIDKDAEFPTADDLTELARAKFLIDGACFLLEPDREQQPL